MQRGPPCMLATMPCTLPAASCLCSPVVWQHVNALAARSVQLASTPPDLLGRVVTLRALQGACSP